MFTDFMHKLFIHSPVAENPNAAGTPSSAEGPVANAAPRPNIAPAAAAVPATEAAHVDVAAILDKLLPSRRRGSMKKLAENGGKVPELLSHQTSGDKNKKGALSGALPGWSITSYRYEATP
jgi:hypothetical protein